MKMEWLQNDHRQYVECAKDLNLAGSCTPPPMEWSHGGRAVQAELRSCATLAILLINIQRLEAREATIRCPILITIWSHGLISSSLRCQGNATQSLKIRHTHGIGIAFCFLHTFLVSA